MTLRLCGHSVLRAVKFEMDSSPPGNGLGDDVHPVEFGPLPRLNLPIVESARKITRKHDRRQAPDFQKGGRSRTRRHLPSKKVTRIRIKNNSIRHHGPGRQPSRPEGTGREHRQYGPITLGPEGHQNVAPSEPRAFCFCGARAGYRRSQSHSSPACGAKELFKT